MWTVTTRGGHQWSLSWLTFHSAFHRFPEWLEELNIHERNILNSEFCADFAPLSRHRLLRVVIKAGNIVELNSLHRLAHLEVLELDEVTCLAFAFKSIGKLVCLKRLKLTSTKCCASDNDVMQLAALEAMEDLSLSMASVASDGTVIFALRSMKRLRRLSFGGHTATATWSSAVFQSLPDVVPHLVSFDVFYCQHFDDDALSRIARMCSSLERLTLRSCAAITNASIQHLHHLSRLYHLEIYNCNNCFNLHSSGDDRFLLRMLSSSENTGRVIQSLGLDNTGDWQVIQPAAAKGCFSHISSLTLAGCSLGKRGLTTLFRLHGNLNHLQNLSLRKCNIDLQKLLVIVKSFKPLRSIDLSGNPVADDSLEHFSDLPVLESLNLSHCRLTDRGIEGLLVLRSTCSKAGHRKFSALREFIVKGSRNITREYGCAPMPLGRPTCCAALHWSRCVPPTPKASAVSLRYFCASSVLDTGPQCVPV